MADSDIQDNIGRVQELIDKAPGNAGGAEMIVSYYENIRNH